MKCKKCGYNMIDSYLGEDNKKYEMCSICLAMRFGYVPK